MEAPDWVAPILAWLTAATYVTMLLVNIVRERKKRQTVRPPLQFSRAHLSYLVTSAIDNWRRFFKVLWATTELAANLASRVGVLVVVAVAVLFGLSLPAAVPDWEWLWAAPVGIAGLGATYAVAFALAKRDLPDDEPDSA